MLINNPKTDKDFYFNHSKPNNKLVLEITEVLKPGLYYEKYKANVIKVDTRYSVGKILVNIQKDTSNTVLNVDDRVLVSTELKELIPPLNPYQFNYKSYLAKQHIYHQIFLDNQQFLVLEKARTTLKGLSASLRSKIQKALLKYNFKDDEYAVISALLLGQRQEISKELLQDYSKAGAIHILAVSGLHVGIILLILNFLFRSFKTTTKRRIFKTFCIVILLWMFAFIAGLSASVVRAVTMFTFVAIGQTFSRKIIIEHSLIASMFFLLIVKPMFLFDVGFQLSYLAVFGIVWVQPLLYNFWKPKYKVIDKLWQLFTVSVAAQAGILPISLFYFHQFPGLFILSNLIIIPFLGTILLGGIVVMLLAVLGFLPAFLSELYQFIIYCMNSVVSWISHQESFLFKELSMSITLMLLWYIFIILLVRAIRKPSAKRVLYLLSSLLIIQLYYVYDKEAISRTNEFIVFHKSRRAIIGERLGNFLHVYHNLPEDEIMNDKMMISYRIGEKVSTSFNKITPNFFKVKNIKILRVDSLGVYNISGVENPIVVLQFSPKINLERLIKTINPKTIIADGSNYKSYINQWEKTCNKLDLNFHYTGYNGAYRIEN